MENITSLAKKVIIEEKTKIKVCSKYQNKTKIPEVNLSALNEDDDKITFEIIVHKALQWALYHLQFQNISELYIVNPQFKPWGLINFKGLNYRGSNWDY